MIISLSGPPGSGKSSIGKMLSKRLSFEFVSYDDFPGGTGITGQELQAWIENDMPLMHLQSKEFLEAVLAKSRNSSLIIETPIGPLHRGEGIKIDIAIWISCELDIVLARALKKIVDEGVWESHVQLQSWVSEYLGAYQFFVAHAIRKQDREIRPECDLIVDGNLNPDELCGQIISQIF